MIKKDVLFLHILLVVLSYIWRKIDCSNIFDICYCADIEIFGNAYSAVKGYFVGEGYMGYVDGEYLLFADESDYRDYMEEE